MFSAGVEDALRVALEAHDGQFRKGLHTVPYVSHPFHVALILARWGQEDSVIQAALLHDVVEDCADWTVERIAERFGVHVAGIVEELTEDKSLTWEERKQAAIDHAAHLSPEAATVKAMDKLHNLESLLHELAAAPEADTVWAKFNGGRQATLTMAEGLVSALERRIDPRMARALRAALDRLVGFAGQSAPA